MRSLAARLIPTYLALVLLAVSTDARAALSMRWTSVAGIIIQDDETSLGFDLVFTRPGLAQWANFRKLQPIPSAIEENLAALQLAKLDALFVSHSHFDHVLDAPWIAHRFGARLFGGISIERIAMANAKRFGWSDLQFEPIVDRQTVTVGKFTIRGYKRTHAAIFPGIGFHFLGGEVLADFRFGFDQYRAGETWCYVIEHPEGKIFVDQGAQFFDGVAADLKGVHFMAIGVSNKKSVEDWIARFVQPYLPKVLVPLHFDWFFSAPRRDATRMLPGTNLDELRRETARVSPETLFPVPKFGETIALPSILPSVVVPAASSTPAAPVPVKKVEPEPEAEVVSEPVVEPMGEGAE